MKTAFFATLLGLQFVGASSYAQRGPQLTDQQRTCIEGKIGKSESGSRPSPDKMKAAFESCGIQEPQRGPGGPGGFGASLTEEQRNCLNGKVAKPGSGSRPSREQMDAAFRMCGIGRPDFGVAGDLPALIIKYRAATVDVEKASIRAAIRQLFYTTQDESLKAQVRQFLRDNPQSVTWSTPVVESQASAGVN